MVTGFWKAWQPNYIEWWKETGPTDYNTQDVYLRTAVSVDTDGWAHFDYVKMPDYRWGIFLSEPEPDRASPSAAPSATPPSGRPRPPAARRPNLGR